MIKNHKNQFINQPNIKPVKKSEKSTGSSISQAYYQSTNGKAWLGVMGFMCSRHTLGLLLLKNSPSAQLQPEILLLLLNTPRSTVQQCISIYLVYIVIYSQ